MTKTKAKKFGDAVPETTAEYHARKLSGEKSFRSKRIRALLSKIDKLNFKSTAGMESLIACLEETVQHTAGWLKFACAINRIDAQSRFEADQRNHSNPAPTPKEKPYDDLAGMGEDDDTHHGMEGL